MVWCRCSVRLHPRNSTGAAASAQRLAGRGSGAEQAQCAVVDWGAFVRVRATEGVQRRETRRRRRASRDRWYHRRNRGGRDGDHRRVCRRRLGLNLRRKGARCWWEGESYRNVCAMQVRQVLRVFFSDKGHQTYCRHRRVARPRLLAVAA